MSSDDKKARSNGSFFARPVRSHEYGNTEKRDWLFKTPIREGALDFKKYPSIINGKQVEYKL